MAKSANITSIETVTQTKHALQAFSTDVVDALMMLELESRRILEWIENDRGRYWPAEERKASDQVIETRMALERCEISASEDTRKSCIDEKKQHEKAKRRFRLCEQKLLAVKRFKMELRKEVEEFQVGLAKMSGYLENDFLRSLAALDRLTASLDRYIQTTSEGPSGEQT